MWILDSSELPTVSPSPPRSKFAHVTQLWYGENRNLALLYGTMNPDDEVFFLGTPYWTGFYYQLNFSQKVVYSVLEGDAWAVDTVIHNITTVDFLSHTIPITLQQVAGGNNGDTLSFDVGGLNVDKVVVEGLSFSSGPFLGQFQQTDNILTIKVGHPYLITPGQLINISGELTLDHSPIASVARFSLPGFDFPSAVSWLGKQFSQSKSTLSFNLYDFTWDSDRFVLTLFFPPDFRLPSPTTDSQKVRLIKINTIEYRR